MKNSKIWGSRRRFLKDVFKYGLATPGLNSILAASGMLWARSAISQEDAPLRYLMFAVLDAGGAREYNWHPDHTGRNFNLNASSMNLSDWKDRMVFIDGVNGIGGHSDRKSFMSNKAKPSLDTYLGSTIGANAPYSNLGVAIAGEGLTSFNFEGKGVKPDTNPFNLYRRFFGTGEASVTIDGLDLNSARYVSVLDSNREMIKDLMLKLGQAQRERFEEVQEAIDATEQAIRRRAASQSGSCSNPAWGGGGLSGSANEDEKADLLIEVIALAFKCDMVRVATVSIDRSDTVPVVNSELHSAAHDGKTNSSTECRLWLNSKLVKIMERLDATIDADGQSVLFNSVIHQISDYGNGQTHDNRRAPILLAGNGRGRLDVGQATLEKTGAYFEVFDTVAQIAGVIDKPSYPLYGGGNPLSSLIKS